jgi:hypothetical protein
VISAWAVICPPRSEYVALHWASLRCNEVTVHTPSLVPDLGVALQQLAGEHDLVAKEVSRRAKIKEVLLSGDGVQTKRRCLPSLPDEPHAGPANPTVRATSATAAPSTPIAHGPPLLLLYRRPLHAPTSATGMLPERTSE